MAIPKFEEDVEVISKLGDYPRSDNNLSTSEFRAKFDEGVVKLRNYINTVLIPMLDQVVDVDALLKEVIDSTLTVSGKSADAKATGDALNKKLGIDGGAMTGDVDMGGNKVSNLAAPTSGTDAANKDYVDGKHMIMTVNLATTGWSDSAPYTQVVTVAGIKDDDYPHYGVILSSDTGTAKAEKEAFALIDVLDTANGSVTFKCFEEKPEANLTIQMEVNR